MPNYEQRALKQLRDLNRGGPRGVREGSEQLVAVNAVVNALLAIAQAIREKQT